MEDISDRVKSCVENNFPQQQYRNGHNYCQLSLNIGGGLDGQTPCGYCTATVVDVGNTACGPHDGNKPLHAYQCTAKKSKDIE